MEIEGKKVKVNRERNYVCSLQCQLTRSSLAPQSTETKVSSILLYSPRQELYHTVFQMREGTEKRQEQHTSLNGFPLSVIPRVPTDCIFISLAELRDMTMSS